MVLLTRTVQESFSKDYFKKAVDTVLKGSIFSKYKIYDRDKRFAIIEIPLNPTAGEMDYRDFLRLLEKVLDNFKKLGFYPSITSSKGFLAIKCYAEYGNFFEKKQIEDTQISPSLGTPPACVGGVFALNTGTPAPTEDSISKSMKLYLGKNKMPQKEDFGGSK